MIIGQNSLGFKVKNTDIKVGLPYTRNFPKRKKEFYVIADLPFYVEHFLVRPLMKVKEKGLISSFWALDNKEEIQKLKERIVRLRKIYTFNEKVKAKEIPPLVYPYKLEPFPHQRIGTSLLIANKAYALFMEQGTGKTKTVIDALNYLYEKKGYSKVIVFAPNSVIYSGWGGDIECNQTVPYRLFYATEGNRAEKRTKMMQWVKADDKALNYLFLSYDFWWRLFPYLRSDVDQLRVKYSKFLDKLAKKFRKAITSPTKREKLLKELNEVLPQATGKLKELAMDAIVALEVMNAVEILVCDESQKIKNYSANRTKAVIALGFNADRRYLLTGTPITNSPTDLFSQGKTLHSFMFNTKTAFEGYFTTVTNPESRYGGRKVLRSDREQEFQWLMNGFAYIVKKDEVLKDLPPKMFIRRDVLLSKKTTKHYLEMERDLATLIETVKDKSKEEIFSYAGSVLSKVIRLNQMASGFIVDENGTSHPLGDEKLKVVEEILEERGPEKKTVIWGVYTWEIERTVKYLKKKGYKVASITGSTPTKARRDIIKDFQEGNLQIIVANPATLGAGVTLTAADAAIYMSLTYKLEDFLQSQDRIHRIGQGAQQVEYFILLSRLNPEEPRAKGRETKTIDRAIYKALKDKQRIADDVVRFAMQYFEVIPEGTPV